LPSPPATSLADANGRNQLLKKNSKIKLSFCIPTLNRGPFLGTTLESIVSQATDEVEIVIVDGGSTDSTQEVIGQFQQRFASLRYFREDVERGDFSPQTPSSVGFDRDCDRAVELAVGEYCWLFTDDDLLRPGAVQTVLEATRQQCGLIVVNAEVRSGDLSKVLEPARLHLTADRAYKSTESQCLFTDVCNYLSFVGSVVIKRELWIARQKEQYIGTGFIHVGMVFQSPVPGKTLVIAQPLVTIRYGDALYMRSSRYFEIWMFAWPNLIWSFPHYSDLAKRQVCPKEPWRHNRTLLLFRAIGAFSSTEYSNFLAKRLNSRWDKFAARLIASFPGSIANLIGVAYYYLSGRPPGQFLLDLVKSPFYFARAFNRPTTSPEKSPSELVPISGNASRESKRVR